MGQRSASKPIGVIRDYSPGGLLGGDIYVPPAGLFGAAPSFGSLTPAEPSYRDTVTDTLRGGLEALGMGRQGAVQNAKGLVGLGEWTPWGAFTAADDIKRSYNKGDYLGTGLGLAMFLGPGAKTAKKPMLNLAEEMLTKGANEKLPLSDLIAKMREKRAAIDRKVADLTAAGKPVRMVSTSGRNMTALVGPDMSDPGMYRITRFDADGPIGHTTHSTFADAVENALRENFDVAPNTPHQASGRPTFAIENPDEETFRAVANGKPIGQLNLTLKRAAPYATSVAVNEKRQGVATALYDAAEKKLGRRLIPSPLGLSPDAIAFWKSRLAKIDPDEKQALLAEALKVGQDAGVGKSARERVHQLGYKEPRW